MTPPPALGVYLHWPYCARVCPYCDFNVSRARGREAESEALGEALLLDLTAQAERLGRRTLGSIHFGGGTPSLMPPKLVEQLIVRALDLFEPSADLEIGLEANPLDAPRFADLRSAGVERLSLGLQSLDNGALRILGRDHDGAEGLRALSTAQSVFPRVSADTIYGRPDQRLTDWTTELAAVAASGIGHLSAYQLTYEAGTAFGRAATRGRLAPPNDGAAADFYEATAQVLTAAGFTAYEVSNWARSAADRSRHNLVYWRGWDYLGVGPGAHGRLTINGVRRATVGARRAPDYLARVTATGVGLDEDEPLSDREAAEERLILGLRIREGAALRDLAPLALDPARPPLSHLLDDGLLDLSHGRLAATRRGRALLDSVTRALAA